MTTDAIRDNHGNPVPRAEWDISDYERATDRYEQRIAELDRKGTHTMTTDAISKYNLKLVTLPGMSEDTFIIQTSTRMFWFVIWDDSTPPTIMDDDDLIDAMEATITELISKDKDATDHV